MPNDTSLSRTTILQHPDGVRISTPLLVPSFSSKGFAVLDGHSEITNLFKVGQEFLTESLLVSAYDIAYGFIPRENELPPELTFCDSGGYETALSHDESAIMRDQAASREWNEPMLAKIYKNWPDTLPAVFVSFDDTDIRSNLSDQISSAVRFLEPYNQLKTILLKPEAVGQFYVDVDRIVDHIESLRPFNILGVTEKELGSSLLDRMQNIAIIRKALDTAGVDIPVHVFGSLDPVGTVLYFLAGAEIFDGLSWLRYGYHEGAAAYTQNMFSIVHGIERNLDEFYSLGLLHNHSYLVRLQKQMRAFVADQDFRHFGFHHDFFRNAHQELHARLNRRN
jgi:hypothetical protein